METDGFSLSVHGKSKLVEILNDHPDILSQYIKFLSSQIILYTKTDNNLSWMYKIICQIFSHFSLTDCVNEESLKQVICEIAELIMPAAFNGSPKEQYRSIKLLAFIFNWIGSLNSNKIYEQIPEILEEGEKICALNLKSNKDKIWNITFELWKSVIYKYVWTKSSGHMRLFDDIFFHQCFNNIKPSIREKSVKALHLTSIKVKKLYQLWFDKAANVRSAAYWKLKGRQDIFEIPPNKLYMFLTQGLLEKDEKVKKDFVDLLISFLVHPDKDQKRKSDDMDQEVKDHSDLQAKEYTFTFNYKFEGSRKRKVLMTFFELFSKLKMHKTHYIDGFSSLPQSYLKFIFNTFERSDILQWMEDTYQSILNVIVRKSERDSITFAHFSFLRFTMEYIKFFLEVEMESTDCIDHIIPDIDDYSEIFKYFSSKNLWRREELEILSEWSKFSLNMSYHIPSIRDKLRELFINYISEPDRSIAHYTYLVDRALRNEREFEKEIEDSDIFSVEHRDFKNIYLKKRSISNICKPVTHNPTISDPDDVWAVMIVVLFQISLTNMKEFISTIKDAVRTVREQIDIEEYQEVEDQLEQSIPQK